MFVVSDGHLRGQPQRRAENALGLLAKLSPGGRFSLLVQPTDARSLNFDMLA